jgi:hypothetical protein
MAPAFSFVFAVVIRHMLDAPSSLFLPVVDCFCIRGLLYKVAARPDLSFFFFLSNHISRWL